MLILKKDFIIGEGNHRICYLHPEDNSKCVKITKDKVRSHKQSRRESEYYEYISSFKKNTDNISSYFGKVDTNLGEGLVFELFRDYDCKVSKTIDYYLKNDLYKESKLIIKSLDDLYNYLINNMIMFVDLKPVNVLFKIESTDFKLMIIDGIGHGNDRFIRISDYFDSIALKKIQSQFKIFISKLYIDYPNNRALNEFKLLKSLLR